MLCGHGALSPNTSHERGNRIGHASVIVADGKMLLLNDTGELILARASSQEYEELARTLILGGEICWTATDTVSQSCLCT